MFSVSSSEPKHMSGAVLAPQRAAFRVACCAALAAIEIFAADAIFNIPSAWSWGPDVWLANVFAKAFLFACVVFVLIAWPRRDELLDTWRQTSKHTQPTIAVLVNLSIFALLLMFRAQLAGPNHGAGAPWALGYSLLIAATGASLPLVAAPLSFWREILKSWRSEIALAIGAAFFFTLAGELSKQSWTYLSGATLHLSHWILSLGGSSVFMDANTQVLGAQDFRVRILADCSGYEGVTLIFGFLVIYFWVFRRSLRFPNVLLLLPVAMTAIWFLNAIRIALLVYIGANISPAIALGGFHSQSGWVCFLLVAIATMSLIQRHQYFSISAGPMKDRMPLDTGVHPRTEIKEEQNPALIFLAPFMALMAAQIAARAFAPHEHVLYPAKVAAVLTALYFYRHVYARLWSRVSPIAIISGVCIGLVWIVIDPGADIETPLERWLTSLAPFAFVAWLALRALGAIIIVPIAEELAFRGYLYRAIISSRFEDVDFRTFNWVALVVSSALFGFLHDRWLAAALAGAIYALLMCRSGRLPESIAAHMASNAVIFGWAVAAGQWSLL